MQLIALALMAILCGSFVYCVLTVLAARSWLRQPIPEPEGAPFVSVLRPLRGAEAGLAENLRSFEKQDYPGFEVLLVLNGPEDTAYAVAKEGAARVVFSGESPDPNGKVHALATIFAQARGEYIVMADSDVRVGPEMLRRLIAELEQPGVGLVTCIYRASAGPSFWTRLEAVGMNTEFLGGVLVARYLGGMDFALGPTIAIRREALEKIGGFAMLREYVAEDFVLGNRTAASGYRVVMSRYVIEHRIGSQGFAVNIGHRLRWCRSTRRSRPWGYTGQVFTNPLPIALLLLLCSPAGVWWLAATLAFRTLAAWATAGMVLRDPLTLRLWWALPLQDCLSFACWVLGYFGNSIQWRGRTLGVRHDGRFQLP